MKVEKKFLVTDFGEIKQRLRELGARKLGTTESAHYYTQLPGNDVVKLVAHSDRCEIHKLEESGGKFSLTKRTPVGSLREGLQWLKRNGYEKTSLVKMVNTDYELADGIVGLYFINDFLQSVILDYAEGGHEAIAKGLRLEGADQIDMPYNKYLDRLGRTIFVDENGEGK